MNKFSRKINEAYNAQKDMAKHRGIDWGFTLDTWCDMWEQSGKWDQRGKSGDQYCMGRKGDQGAYSPNNVYIITNRENTLERHRLQGCPFSGSNEQRKTQAYYVYDGVRFEKQEELCEQTGYSLRNIQKMVSAGKIEKFKPSEPKKFYCTPYGDFTKAGLAVDAVRENEGIDVTRQTLFHRYRNDKFPTFYVEVRQEPDTKLN